MPLPSDGLHLDGNLLKHRRCLWYDVAGGEESDGSRLEGCGRAALGADDPACKRDEHGGRSHLAGTLSLYRGEGWVAMRRAYFRFEVRMGYYSTRALKLSWV